MNISKREVFRDTITFNNPKRLSREPFFSDWSQKYLPEQVAELKREYAPDVQILPLNGIYNPSSKEKGDWYEVGEFIDSWGCKFINIHRGVIGEVKQPIADGDDYFDIVKPPYELLPSGLNEQRAIDKVNKYCEENDVFCLSGFNPHPWERYQFLRGPENAYADMVEIEETRERLKVIQDYYLKSFEFWLKTNIDGIYIADDWGSQNSLLINPKTWRELFKPLYKEYADMAKAAGKYVCFHSDGYIMDIYEDFIEIGVDTVNSQLFCMDIEKIAEKYKGRIAFWGEIDRQHVMVSKNLEDGTKATKRVLDALWEPKGGYIFQFEFTAGANPKMPMHLLGTAYSYVDELKKTKFAK